MAAVPDLRITRIDVFQVNLPYSGGTYHLSHNRTYTSFDATIVRITAGPSNLEGWGESTPFGANFVASHPLGVRAGIALLAPALIGLDPRRVDRINDVMDRTLTGNEGAKTALDVACWDLFGKSVGLPICELLGGRTEEQLPLVSSVPVGAPEEMREKVAKYRAQGYRSHSIKIGAEDPVVDAARISACLADKREGEYFIVDANGGLTTETALRMIRLLPANADIVLEAPCATWRECKSLRQRTAVPIHYDELAINEASAVQMLAEDAADGIGLKISKNGGLTRARRIKDICLAAGYTMTVQETAGSDVAFAAIVHLAQTVPGWWLRGALDSREMVTVRTADGEFDVKGGMVKAPRSPGLGVAPRMDVLGEPVASYC